MPNLTHKAADIRWRMRNDGVWEATRTGGTLGAIKMKICTGWDNNDMELNLTIVKEMPFKILLVMTTKGASLDHMMFIAAYFMEVGFKDASATFERSKAR